MCELSIVLPAKNEAESLKYLLPELRHLFPEAELVVVDDGSEDETAAIVGEIGGKVQLVHHPVSRGNGAAIKSGARAATGKTLVLMDADGQHQPQDISLLLARMDEGYDMVVGARDRDGQANWWRWIANSIYNRLAQWMCGQVILDLTSGFRAVNARKFRSFLYLLPNGFSYPTTSTMAFLRVGYSVGFCPVRVVRRSGSSHLSLLKDGTRFFLIIFRIGTLYSPIKLFFPLSGLFFCLGLLHYSFTYITEARFTNMSALLFITSILVFAIGLVSEQISMLYYQQTKDKS